MPGCVKTVLPNCLCIYLSEFPKQLSCEGGVNCSDKAFGGRPSILPANCLSFLPLIRENQFVSNASGKKNFVIDIKPDEVRCIFQNYVYLPTGTY